MKKKYSIIMPLYNTETYLKECIESVLYQTYPNWELIIINDGSTDNSLEIANFYKNLDKRIKVFSQKNSGVSIARNTGLNNATGDYILFIDSDDWYEKEFIEEISKYDEDFICCGYNKCFVNNRVGVFDENIMFLNFDCVKEMIHVNKNIEGFLVTKVFSKKIIDKNKLEFSKNINYCEDLFFVDNYFEYCKSFRYIPKALYNYRMRMSSVSFSFINKKNLTILDVYEYFIKKYAPVETIANYNKYKYLFNYYKLKKIATSKNIEFAKNISHDERKIINKINLSLKEKINYYIVKHSNTLYILLKKIKDKKLNLYK